nr:unnamed protein product [Salmo salar]|eukprot:XP_014030874.1 PREDICTED: immunoglobulin superfamily member 1-like isoform X1 [Salmo salar]
MAALGLLWLVIATASILVKCEGTESEDKKIYPAKIFGPSNVTEGEKVNFKCSTTGIRGPEDKLHFYLCKNGVGMKMKVLEKGENDAIFTMKNVTREDSGNYSCVYTRDKPVPSHLKSTGENLLVFHVDGGWKEIYPAKIFGPSNVTEGEKVNFKCSTTGIRGPEDKLHFYLCKNGVGMKMKVLEKGENDAIFTMKNVTREDSGNYSCVYTRDKPVPSHLKSTGENLIVFHVDGGWKEIYPAKIFGPSNVTEGEKVYFKCSTTGIRGPEDKLHFYLCKNGVGIRIAELEKGENDAIFTMKDVTREDSGNYSCVYTRDTPVHSHLKSTGENLIVFHVDGEWKEGLKNVGGQGGAGLAALVLLFLMLSLLLLLWRYWGILKQMISIDHQPRENQDTDQTYSLISAVPVAAGVISPTDPTGDEALYSVITRVKRPEQQGETATYAKVTKTKKEKEKQDPVYSLLNREDTVIL